MSSAWLVVAPLLIVAASIVAVAGLILARRNSRFERSFAENEVAGHLLAAVGVIYGAMLAFVVFATWETFAGAQQAVTMEAADLVAAYRDTQAFPQPQRGLAQQALRTYATSVTSSEWTSHGTLVEHTTPDLLNPVWDIYRSIEPLTASEATDLSGANDRLHTLELQRHLRHLAGEASLPWVFWPLLVLGGVVVIVFSYFFRQTSLRAQAVMTGVSTAMLTGVLVLIYSLNQPFTGPVTVTPQPFLHALQQFHAIDLGS